MKINISEIEALRAKMTPGPYRFDDDGYLVGDPDHADGPLAMALFDDGCTDADGPGLVAEHNAIPALLALARAVEELEKIRCDYSNAVEDCQRIRPLLAAAHAAYDAARAAVTL